VYTSNTVCRLKDGDMAIMFKVGGSMCWGVWNVCVRMCRCAVGLALP
jgi:hypothetical protein